MGIDAVRGVGGEVLSIAQALETMSKMANPKEIDLHITNITKVITAVSEAFAAVGMAADGKKPEGNAFTGLFIPEGTYVEKGIKMVKGAGEELNTIVDAFVKLKQGKDEKELDITDIGKKIAQMLSFSAGLFGYLGSGDEACIPTNLTGMGLEKVKNSLNDGSIGKGVEAAKGLINGVEELGKLADAIGKLKSDNNKGLETLASQYQGMVNVINSTNIKEKSLYQYNTIVTNIDRLSSASKGFTEFEKSYDKFEKNFKKTRDGINGIDLPKFQAYNRMLELHVDLAKISRASDINKMTEGMREFMKEFADGLVMAVDRVAAQMDKQKDNFAELVKINKELQEILNKQGTANVRVTNMPSRINDGVRTMTIS